MPAFCISLLALPLTFTTSSLFAPTKATSAPIETRLEAAAPPKEFTCDETIIQSSTRSMIERWAAFKKAILIETSWGTEERRSITSLYSIPLISISSATALNESEDACLKLPVSVMIPDNRAKAVFLIMVAPFFLRFQELSLRLNFYCDEGKKLNSLK